MMELAALVPLPLRGAIPAGAELIEAGGWGAVLAPVPAARPLLFQRKTALEQGLVRQRLLEALMAVAEVVPVAPGTMVQREEVAQIVALNRAALITAVAGIEGRAQYQLTVFWDQAGVLSRFRASPELAGVFAAGKVDGPQLQTAIRQLADRLEQTIDQFLAPLTAGHVEQPKAEGVVYNAALLIERSRALDLDQALEQIDAIWPEGFRLRLVGPSPAVSFALATLVWASADDVTRAIQLLGVGLRPTSGQIEAARRRCLRDADANVAVVNNAARLLVQSLQGTVAGRVPIVETVVNGTASAPGLGKVA